MMKTKRPILLGLLGKTGVGKDTCVGIIKNHFSDLSIAIVRLADPLYQAQDVIYKLCKTPKDYHTQDGELLNFLGLHMRKINPEIIKESFYDSLNRSNTNTDCIICPDVRAVDVPFVRSAGFTIIHIDTDPETTLERRKLRGDVTLGKTNHETENGISPSLYDHHLTNNGSLEILRNKIINLVEKLII